MTSIKRVPIAPNIDRNNYNNHNLHEYDPYILDSSGDNSDKQKVIIDQVWFDSLTGYVKSLIEERLTGQYILGEVKVPHAIHKDIPDKLLVAVYQSYIDGFDYNIWYHPDLPCGPSRKAMIIPISNEVKKCLMYDVNLDEELSDFETEIQHKFESDAVLDGIEHQSYFVRLSSTSGKNERSVPPLTCGKDVVRHLIGNRLFVDQEYNRLNKPSSLIMIPWNNKINPRFEFRIFVVNNRLVAASPQKWWELIQHTGEELELFEEAFSRVEFIGHELNPYHTFVADVYVDPESRSVKLIEFNPFGAHCGAGSSLFNWITDYDLLHGKVTEYAELRYLSAINY